MPAPSGTCCMLHVAYNMLYVACSKRYRYTRQTTLSMTLAALHVPERAAPRPGADGGGVSPQSRCSRCRRGKPSPGADVGGVSPEVVLHVPEQAVLLHPILEQAEGTPGRYGEHCGTAGTRTDSLPELREHLGQAFHRLTLARDPQLVRLELVDLLQHFNAQHATCGMQHSSCSI